MKSLTKAALVSSFFWAVTQVAAATCVKVEPGETIGISTPVGAARLVAIEPPRKVRFIVSRDVTPGAVWVARKAEVTALSQQLQSIKNAPERSAMRLAFVAADDTPIAGTEQFPFFVENVDIPATKAACEASAARGAQDGGLTIGSVAVDAPVRARPADTALCARLSAERLSNTPYESWVLFNTTGAACYVPFPLRQRDTLRFGVVVANGEPIPDAVSVNVTGCTVPTSGPIVFSSGSIPDVFKQSAPAGAAAVARGDLIMETSSRQACASSSPVAATTVTYTGQTPVTQNTTLNLFERHTATVHLGVLFSKLREPEFGVRTVNGQTVITDKESDSRGPQYVAMVIVQALPRYFQSGGLSYPGRDLQHDNAPMDRLGLALSFGLNDPGKRFGVGLSYEIANGINLVAVREWFKRSRLDGVNVGDAFTGSASDIPTRKEWAKAWALGLSFDVGYVTSIFGGKK